jgi:restriction endonuclease Mrr
MGCVALFVFVILGLVAFTLYERGYLSIALAIVSAIAVSVGLLYAYRTRVARRDQPTQRRRRQGEGRQGRLRREQERPSGRREAPALSAPQARREGEERPRDQFERDAIVQRLNEISEGEFERSMASYFRRLGYGVESTPASSGDRGADLRLTATDRHIVVRLKRQGVPVGNRAVQEALSGRAFYGAYETWVITNNTFTRTARNDAVVAGVRLIDGSELAEWLSKLLDQPKDESR